MKKTHHEYLLSNGLKVLLKEIHTAPLISSWIWYRVGSRDESSGLTGISHWVEHMQFKGTPQFPASILDRAISRDGGIWNAFTYVDWTTYFETMPADKIDLGLRLEADRMVNSLFDQNEVNSERTVIISEREGSENSPQFLLYEAVQHAAFGIHPYHHMVIGEIADLRTISRDDLYNHYRAHYIPNNAVLSVAGDFIVEEMLERIRGHFEAIPAGPDSPRLNMSEPELNGEHSLTVEGPGDTTFIQVAYRAPTANDPDFFALTGLDSLLAGPSSLNAFGGGGISNKTSRLYRALVEKELAVSVSAGLAVTIDPFLYNINITVHPERNPKQVLAALDEEIRRIQEQPVSSEEINRSIKQARALFAYNSENITSQASWLGQAEMFASYDWFLTYLDNLAKVTSAELLTAAQRYLRPQNRVVGIYQPTGMEAKP